jgi:hypothetical protein
MMGLIPQEDVYIISFTIVLPVTELGFSDACKGRRTF